MQINIMINFHDEHTFMSWKVSRSMEVGDLVVVPITAHVTDVGFYAWIIISDIDNVVTISQLIVS